MPTDVDQLAADLGTVLGAPVTDLRRLSGGASRETWRFRSGGRDLILQRTRAAGSVGAPSMEAEDRLLAAAAAAGVPVPPTVVGAADAGPLGSGRVTEVVPGEALGPRLVRAERTDEGRAALARQMGEALAAIHAIPVDDHPGLVRKDVLEQARGGLDVVGEARPAFELALRWLADTRPPASEDDDRVVHGDFRVGNLLVDGDRLTAVLDWELAHRGDPLEDLGWLCVRAWRFGGDREVGGLADLDDLLAAYADARGVAVSPEHVRWWTAAGTLTWGLICAVQARRHLDGHVRSVELATIGRRVCENEHDLLDLMGVPPATGPVPEVDHGRPTAEELLDAVRSHLVEEVAPQLSGATAFSLRVVDRALATVQREVAQAAALHPAPDEAALAREIRDGCEVTDELRARVRAAVTARLAVANPRWL